MLDLLIRGGDVVDPKRFAAIGSNGYSYCMKASFENGVRPVFAIG